MRNYLTNHVAISFLIFFYRFSNLKENESLIRELANTLTRSLSKSTRCNNKVTFFMIPSDIGISTYIHFIDILEYNSVNDTEQPQPGKKHFLKQVCPR